MNKLLSIFFILVLIGNFSFAQQKKSRAKFTAKIVPTLADASCDFWYKSYKKGTFTVPIVREVVANQVFRLCIFFSNYGVKDNKANVKFWIKRTNPDGSVGYTKNKVVGLSSVSKGDQQIVETIVPLSFTKDDPKGKYKFQVLCIDYVNKKKLKRSFEIELQEWKRGTFPSSQQEYSKWVTTYYTNPTPNQVIHAFLTYFEPVNRQRKTLEYHILHFFKVIFSKNEYLFDLLLKDFSSYSNAEKVKVAALCNAINKTDKLLPLCNDAERQMVSKAKMNAPDAYGEILDIQQVSMLWMEFYATGTLKPLVKVVNILEYEKYLGAQKKYGKATQGHELEIMKDILCRIAIVSLDQHRVFPLVTNYYLTILDENKESPTQPIQALHKLVYRNQQNQNK